MRRFLGGALLFFGGMGVGIWGWSLWRQSVEQKQDEAAFERQQAAPIRPESPPAAPKSMKSSGSGLVARLSIPRIQLRAMVREGDDDDTLDVALGHIPGTALPGQKGNVGLAGHRDRLFSRLAELGRNDRIELETPRATYTYKVDDMEIVSPKMVGVLSYGREARLTLVTCYPFHYIGSAPKRYIVKAHLVSRGASEGSLPDVQSGTRD